MVLSEDDIVVGETVPGGVVVGGSAGKRLTGMEIPKSVGGLAVVGIGASAPSGDETLQRVLLPDPVTTIGNNAFAGCSNLESVDMPDSVTTIGDGAFENTALGDLQLSSSLESTGDNAFSGCDKLLSANMPTRDSEWWKRSFCGL